MTEKNEDSLFGKLFSRNSKDSDKTIESNDQLLLECLHSLSTIGEGRHKTVDSEISNFKKMIKIGATVDDLKQQVIIISNTLESSAASPKNDKLVKLFKQMPAEILIDEFLAQLISPNIKSKLTIYSNSLSQDSRAVQVIPDLINLLEPDQLDATTSAHHAEQNQQIITSKANFSTSEMREITSPLLHLFSQMEFSPEQDEGLRQIQKRADSMNDLKQLGMFIEDVSQIILTFISKSSGKFESFLIQLKKRLDTVNSSFSKNLQTNQAISKCGDSISQCISNEVNQLQTSLNNIDDISNLEKIIAASLEIILNGVTTFDSARKTLETEATNRIADLKHELDQTRSETEQLKDNLQEQRKRALTDPLTKLPNRHSYNERLQLEFNRWKRYSKPLSLVMGDIDYFKLVNDTHGHLAGDTALIETARIIQDGLRETDFVARFGGEEFVIIMPETNLNEATKAINKIRLSIQEHLIIEDDVEFKVTVSFGVAVFEDNDLSNDVVNRADKAMYRAKDKGRNQVCAQRK